MKTIIKTFAVAILLFGLLTAGGYILLDKSPIIAVQAAEEPVGDGEADESIVNEDAKRAAQAQKDEPVKDKLGEKWNKMEGLIALCIFAVFFIVGIYWWTYGKLHHKLPRY